MEAEISERVSQALAAWRRCLLDLSRKNTLVYYKSRKASSLEAVRPDVFRLVDELDEDGDGWEVYLPPEPAGEDSADIAAADENDGEDDGAQGTRRSANESDVAGRPNGDDAKESIEDLLVFSPRTRKGVERRLRNLRRRSETDLNDRGVHVLFVAAGFLEWKDPASQETVRSPLLLFPVSIEQDSLFDPWRVVPAGEEEVLVNPALRQKMLQDFRLALPELPSPEEVDRSEGEELCRRYFADIRGSLVRASLNEWRVQEEAVLDLFSFHKLVMYRDLEQNAGRAESHKVIRGFASKGETDEKGPGSGFQDDKGLDHRLPYKEQFQVLDADSSQLAVLEAARAGLSLVLQGPPGTGKSQTIANLIAQSVADGRRVLFVSEKMAALDVVKKRLAHAGLDDLCLELHSHKTNRKLVVGQLARSMEESFAVEGGSILSVEEMARLEERRRELREYVEALHRRREPLGRSVGSVLGELARLHAAPARPLPEPSAVEVLDAAAIVRIQGLIDTIANCWNVLQAGGQHPWYGLRPDTHGFQLDVTLMEELRLLGALLDDIRVRTGALAARLGLPAPTAVTGALELGELARLVEKSPGVWRGLFLDAGKSESVLATGRQLGYRSRQAREGVAAFFPAGEPRNPPASNVVTGTREGLEAALGAIGLGVPPPDQLGTAAPRLDAVVRIVELVSDVRDEISRQIGLSATVEDGAKLHGLNSVIREVLAGRPFPRGFFATESLLAAKARFAVRWGVWARGAESRAAVTEDFDASVLDLELKRLVEDYRSRYQGPMRFLRPSYYRDRKAVRAAATRHLIHDEVLPALERARAAQVALKEVSEGLADDLRAFGELARGIATDVPLVRDLIDRAESVLSSAPQWPLPPTLGAALCAGGLLPPELRSVCERFVAVTDELLASMKSAGLPAPHGTLADLPCGLAEFGAAVHRAEEQVRGAIDVTASCLLAGLVDPRWDRLAAAVAQLEQLREAEEALHVYGDRHAELLGPAFRGEATDWDTLRTHAAFAAEIGRQTGGRPPDPLVEVVGAAKPRFLECDLLDGLRSGYGLARDAVVTRFEKGPLATTAAIDRMSFDEIQARLEIMAKRIDEVDAVLAFARAESNLRSAGFHTNVGAFLDPTLSAVDFCNGLRRSILQTWVDIQSTRVPVLQHFDGRRHDVLVQEFRSLETRFIRSGPARILDRVGDRTTDGDAGEAFVIRREAAKRSRHIPLRKLFLEAYTIIPKLKPCLLMSPLSVAQFLKDSPIRFDLVVFDEASQIFTEDAIGAVMRGDQLVVAGDEKQLPPSNFFEASQAADGDGTEEQEESDEQPEFESVLTACSTLLPQKMLRWHYRSRHESLIAFSNSRFYENRLVTFPSATDANGELGVHWEHVEDGVYDRGKSRTNAREASRMVDLVVEHWRNRPGETLGVVTLSQAQMDRVDDELQRRVRNEPDLEGFYSEEGDDAFFVKNLENVQGDERDHIILGIGYGKDVRGILTSNFGPLNKPGGERRLNVAITRAKRCLTAVSSFRYSELQVSAASPAGLRHLQKFLEFAERGIDALETANVGGGETESPLEDSVADFLKVKGFAVELQIGCSGFRIDIGVRDPALPGRFVLGVECDGATYHSAATVRDRDRLRQSELERHGWTIHRIWSPDWIRRRTAEEKRLLDAVDRAAREAPARPSRDLGITATRPVRLVARDTASRPANGAGRGLPTREFRATTVVLSTALRALEPHEAPQSELLTILHKMAIDENGIARDRAFRLVTNAWGVQRIGHRIRAYFDEACSLLKDRLTLDGDFLLPPSYKPAILLNGTVAATQRDFVHVPAGELLLAIRSLLERNGSMVRAELEREVASMYNVRAARHAREWMSAVVELGVRQKMISLVNHRVQLVG